MGHIFAVCIPHTSRDFFDYHSVDDPPAIGARVMVPFRNKQRLGIVIDKKEAGSGTIKTKGIDSILDDTPLIPKDLLTLCQWVSHYYQSPLSEVLPLALPKKYRQGDASKLPTGDYFQLIVSQTIAHERLSRQAKKQHELVDFLAKQNAPCSKKTLQNYFNLTQINALLTAKIIEKQEKIQLPISPSPSQNAPLSLNEEQEIAVSTIQASLDRFKCFLLQGVTGSGKTEVYLQLIACVLAAGKQVLVLVPEIGLTPQLLTRFSTRFTEPMAVVHSHLNDSERQYAWQLAHDDIAKLIIGTRSAVFTPMPSLGLIVIDEEHDASLKQMDGVRYSARDTALMRAHTRNIPIILGSATPSLETLYNCFNEKYSRLLLTQKALLSSPLKYQIMDIRNKPLFHGLAQPALERIKAHLEQQNQVLVFINRRGFAPVLLCHQCGWMADCKACDSHLTLHQTINKLICHHCGLTQVLPKSCKSCQSAELLPIGAGTQRVHDYLSTLFPSTSIARVDRDEVRRKNALDHCLQKISTGETQLVVGTQMLAKGHHFPRLTLVVILDADNGFYNQDFRALERLGQLLTQVAGRAGRAERPGEVVIQTHLPQHPLLNLLVQEGYEPFAQALLEQRGQAKLPPFQYLAVIRAQGKSLPNVLHFLHQIKNKLTQDKMVALGPAPAPLARKADYYRMQLLIKSPSRKKLNATLTNLRQWLTIKPYNNGVRWNVDVDPMDLS